MFINFTQIIYFFGLVTGTIIACSSSSWVMVWLGLELNLMSMIPILINKINPNSSEMAIKYFLTQALASMIIIFIIMTFYFFNKTALIHQIHSNILSMALSLKAGIAPFHFWFPQVMEFCSWTQAAILLTWQKIAPFLLLSFSLNSLMLMFMVISSLLGMTSGLNQTKLKKILTFSSIIHSSWLIATLFINELIWWIYFLSYAMITFSVIFPFFKLNVVSLKEIFLLNNMPMFKMIMLINILSLAGIPPFLGFFLKFLTFNGMLFLKFNFLIIFSLIFSSLISFYFYYRILYTSFLYSSPNFISKMFLQKTFFNASKIILVFAIFNIFMPFLVLLS